MNDFGEIKRLLSEMNERQKQAYELQKEMADLTRKKFQIADKQVTESVELQKLAIERQAKLVKFIVPLIVVMVVYLVCLTIV